MLEPVFDPAETIRGKRESARIENRLLDAGHETELQAFANFADFTQESEVENQRLVLPAPKIVEKFVHDHQQAVFGMDLVKSRHHILERGFVLGHLVRCREDVIDTHGG